MRTPLKSSLGAYTDNKAKIYKTCKALVIAYSTITKRANIQLLGSMGGILSGVPVSIPCHAFIKANMTAVVVFTETGNVSSCVVVGLL